VPDLVNSVRPSVEDCKSVVAALADVITPNQFWRYKDMWSQSLRSVVFAIILVQYLEDHTLAPVASVTDALGSEDLCPWILAYLQCYSKVQKEWESRFTVSIEDYLHALISVVNELVSSSRTDTSCD
jgi:hypothetical protein